MMNLKNINLIDMLSENLTLLKLELRKIAKPTDDLTKIDGVVELITSFGFKATTYNSKKNSLYFKYVIFPENHITKSMYIEFNTFDDYGEIEFALDDVYYADNGLKPRSTI